MIYPIQIRAARSLLGLSQDELARRANLSVVTIKRLEAAGTEITRLSSNYCPHPKGS